MKKRKIILPIFLVFLFWAAAAPVEGAAKSNIQLYSNEKNEEEKPIEKELYKPEDVKTGDENDISVLYEMVLFSTGSFILILFSKHFQKRNEKNVYYKEET